MGSILTSKYRLENCFLYALTYMALYTHRILTRQRIQREQTNNLKTNENNLKISYARMVGNIFRPTAVAEGKTL